MKPRAGNLIYSIKLDQQIFEYRLRNVFIKSLFNSFHLSTQITLPVNQIIGLKIRKALLGNFATLTITKYSTRKNAGTRKVRLRKFWFLRQKSIRPLQHISNLNVIETKRQLSAKHPIEVHLVNHGDMQRGY